MTVTPGRIVLYVLTANDVVYIERQRQSQLLKGNSVYAGLVLPMIVVHVWPNEYGEGVPGVNGHVALDGNDALWVTSAREGTGVELGTWHWPPRV